ncbi:MAG: hypothetical protein JOZ48_02335, partial [Acidobacteriaceae bacterium]|nr:hypothetical protein [Acidobacteriaceae bacterium]
MPDLIGVTDMLAWTPGFAKYGQLLHPLNRLKRFALLFDRLAAFGLDVALDRPKRIWGDKQFRSELKWLRDKGILYNIEPSKIFGKQQEFTVREDLTVDEVVEKLSQDPRAFLQLATGLGTDLLRRGSRDEFVSLTAEDLRDEVFDFGATTHLHDVLYVVLANIPEPDEKTA